MYPVVSHELRTLILSLRSPSLLLIVLALLLALLLVVHTPLSYTIDVGVEEGYGGDLPLLWGFNTAEDDEHGTYRWTKDAAAIRLPGLGHRPLHLRLDFTPISPQVVAAGPSTMELWVGNTHLATLPVSEAGKQYNLLIPPQRMQGGRLALTFRTTTFTPPDDPRELGTPLDAVKVMPLALVAPIAPDWAAVWMWSAALVLCWLLTLRALEPSHESVRWARWFVGGAAALVALAALLDPPRWAYGAQPALVAATLSYALVLLLRPTLPTLAARLHIPLDRRTLRWLLLIVAVAFGIRFGGRLFPLSMWGDIGFHTNRFIDTLGLGKVYLLSRNRGVNFPYPPGPYLTLAPLTLLPTLDIRIVLPFAAALVDALSAPLVYAIVTRTCITHPHLQHAPAQQAANPTTRFYQYTGLLAAALYVFTAAGIMLTWWSFDTHIYAQFASLLLITALAWVATAAARQPSSATHHTWSQFTRHASMVIGVLAAGVFLGHFGFLINTVLMGGVLLVLLWVAAWRGNMWAHRLRWPFFTAYASASLVAVLFFYTAYLWLFLNQLSEVNESGLTGLAERAPVPRWYLWHILWEQGIIQHFGFFPLLLLPVGMWLVFMRRTRTASSTPPPTDATTAPTQAGRTILFALMACSVLVSSCFAVLPFITLSTQSTRWLTFSAWAIAIAAALAWQVLWRSGRAGRVVVLAMGGFVVWNTVVFWVGPMLWRIRPPEPF
jgi:hypothetical protein